MLIDDEAKAKIAVQSCIGTALICLGMPWLGVLCYAVMLPWSAIGRVGGWLAAPVVRWRAKKGGSNGAQSEKAES